MGVVYKAHHAMLRRPTAIKLLNVEKTTDAAVKRFEREVRLTCQLTHPNTIAIFDYGRTPEGLFYYAMEYLEGLSLQELVDRHGPQPEGRVVLLLEQICGSLAEAHEAGLVHRDIKPANVMLTNRGGMFDFVKVLDFGLVRSSDDKDLALTAAGGLTGTPLYMSPEAIERPKDVDARSDLYAVGAVGYFLLTGEPVFIGKSVLDVCMQHFTGTPVRPSKRVGSPISPALEDLILSCLAKRAADRPATAARLAADLAALAPGMAWTRRDAERWWQERTGPTVTLEEVASDNAQTAHNQMLVTIVQEERASSEASTEIPR
jgi:serine/threonine protein kinase